MPSKTLLAIVAGTILEYFDFLLFAHFGLIITPLFFCELDPIVATLQGITLLAIGFFMRPIGAVIFGRIGDLKGRKPALVFALLCITLPTFVISLLPGYKTIGITAPFILILCRMIQGISLGGEYTNAGILLMELSSFKKRGFYSGVLCASASVGCTIALICSYIVLRFEMFVWAWRIPFLLASLLGLASYKLRVMLLESPEFISSQKNNTPSETPVQTEKISENKIAFFITISIGAFVGALIWTPMAYTNFYLTKVLEWQATDAVFMTLLLLVTYITTTPLAGILGDHIKKVPSLMLWTALLATFLSYPLLLCLTHGYVVITQIGFGLLASFFGACVHPVMIDLYPTHKRCQSISLGFAIGMGIGGTTPLIEIFLADITNDYTSPAIYISVLAITSAIAMYLHPFVEIKNNSKIY
ncbi:MAG: MFS transporter [Alphaproteobacteria bacterium]|nr:MFS transporter [Alphaproteobacteria bacterium]